MLGGVLKGMTESNNLVATYIDRVRETHNALLEAQRRRPWWAR
jgi:hypothetical protein